VTVIVVDSLRVWYGILSGSSKAHLEEAPFVLSVLKPEEA